LGTAQHSGQHDGFRRLGGFGPSQYLYDSYDAEDKRKTAFFWTEFAGIPQTPPAIKKFWDPKYGNEIVNDDLNFIYIRYADVFADAGQALNAIDDKTDAKYDCLNEVRRRAGLGEINRGGQPYEAAVRRCPSRRAPARAVLRTRASFRPDPFRQVGRTGEGCLRIS